MGDVMLQMMFLELQCRDIHIERLRQQCAHIAHRFFSLPHLYEIQNLGWIRQRVLNFLGEVGVAVLSDRNMLAHR